MNINVSTECDVDVIVGRIGTYFLSMNLLTEIIMENALCNLTRLSYSNTKANTEMYKLSSTRDLTTTTVPSHRPYVIPSCRPSTYTASCAVVARGALFPFIPPLSVDGKSIRVGRYRTAWRGARNHTADRSTDWATSGLWLVFSTGPPQPPPPSQLASR